MLNIHNNLQKIRNELQNTHCELIAVSKTFNQEYIANAYHYKQHDFAENYVQEFIDKAEQLRHLNITWHFIGKIQSNKIKYIAKYATWVHSLSKLEHAKKLNSERAKHQLPRLKVLLEINITHEENKGGINIDDIDEIINLVIEIQKLEHLQLCGLMAMASNSEDANLVKSQFMSLKKLRDKLEKQADTPLPELSIGMSNDYKLALECGATMIRVGSKIFGSR